MNVSRKTDKTDNDILDNKLSEFFSNSLDTVEYISHNSIDTIDIAEKMAKYLTIGNIVVLVGELGSGKTLFVSGIAKYFGIIDSISSPTFTIVNEYLAKKDDNPIHIYHFDVYRIKSVNEFVQSVGTEYFSNGICFIEWGQVIQDILPKNTIYIQFTKDEDDENVRYLKISRRLED